jgi:hypothetical protein
MKVLLDVNLLGLLGQNPLYLFLASLGVGIVMIFVQLPFGMTYFKVTKAGCQWKESAESIAHLQMA